MKRNDGDYNLFDFKPSFQSDTIRVEWPVESAIALFPSDVSIILIRLGHARNLSNEEVEQYNASIDFLDDKEPEPVIDPPKDDVPADEKPADVQAEEKSGDDDVEDATGNEDDTEEKKKPGRPKKPVAIPGLTN